MIQSVEALRFITLHLKMFASVLRKRFVYLGGVSLSLFSIKVPIVYAQASVDAPSTTSEPPKIEDDDDETWEKRKKQCSFCRQFLDSPCKFQFRQWSRCVDKAKEENREFVEACMLYTRALLNCTTDNAEYFEKLKHAEEEAAGSSGSDDDDDDDDIYDDDDDDDNEDREEISIGDSKSDEK